MFRLLTKIPGLLFCLILSVSATAQIDTEFWFAAPEVSAGHADQPVFLRISALSGDATVQVFMPAVQNNPLITSQISANTTGTIQLSNLLHLLETSPPNKVLKTGLFIKSSTPVSCYYEVGAQNNADIFALKGKNALGNHFIIPSQDQFFNGRKSGYIPLPFSSFDIIASENNTVVWITPSNPIFGHAKDTTFIVKLNKGQTYSATNVSEDPFFNLSGSVVRSNKPIAITLKEDSMENGTCYDLLGDQHVPVKVAGKEYIVLKGFLETPEYVFIIAIEDSTALSINGNALNNRVLKSGELMTYPITASSTYIAGSKPVYVMHVTGFGCEIGMAVLPSINCKGSQEIAFSRATDEFFGLNILVRSGGTDGFLLNGNPDLISNLEFDPVPGTDNKWYSAQLEFDPGRVPVGLTTLISNKTHSFQVGIINGDARTSSRFGYFSAFSTLFIGDDTRICTGQSITLNAGYDKESYQWSDGSTGPTLEVNKAGTYWVTTARDDCILMDSITIATETATLDLGEDVIICPGATTAIDAGENFSYNWSDGSQNRILQTTIPGKYGIEISNYTGCTASDSIEVSFKAAPSVDLGPDLVKCPYHPEELNAYFPDATYRWQDGSDDAQIVALDSGLYWVDVTWNGCSTKDSIQVALLDAPLQDTIIGSTSVCPFAEAIDYEVGAGESVSYQWWVDGGSYLPGDQENQARVNWLQASNQAVVKALVTDQKGCQGDTIRLPVRINVKLEISDPVGNDTICFGDRGKQIYRTNFTNGTTYQWNANGGAILAGQGNNEVTVDWLDQGNHHLEVAAEAVTSDTVCFGQSDPLQVVVFRDSASIELLTVSADTTNNGQILLFHQVANTHRLLQDSTKLFKLEAGRSSWQSQEFNFIQNPYPDQEVMPDQAVYHYQIDYKNLCGDANSTTTGNSILLAGNAAESDGNIDLNWNHYQDWPQGVEAYEVWVSYDQQDFQRLQMIPRTETSIAGISIKPGFKHKYRVVAIPVDQRPAAYSNLLEFNFEHPIAIPNVITPNLDNHNETFVIENIELYPNNRLTIYNRWGKELFVQHNYHNNFSGRNLVPGVYFYTLFVERNQQEFRGFLQVLK